MEWRRKQESDREGGEEEEVGVGVRWRDSSFLLDGRNNSSSSSSRRSKRATQ